MRAIASRMSAILCASSALSTTSGRQHAAGAELFDGLEVEVVDDRLRLAFDQGGAVAVEDDPAAGEHAIARPGGASCMRTRSTGIKLSNGPFYALDVNAGAVAISGPDPGDPASKSHLDFDANAKPRDQRRVPPLWPLSLRPESLGMPVVLLRRFALFRV